MELQLQNLKPTKSDIKIASDRIIQQVESGEVNPVDVALQLKVIEELVKETREKLNEYALAQLQHYPFGKAEMHGAKIETAETGVKYDYSGDSTWAELKARNELSASALKQREDLLKKIPAGHTLVDENGEAAIGPTKSSTTSYKITLAK